MFEAEFKQHLIRINNLEIELKNSIIEKVELEFQFEKIREIKKELAIELRNAKNNLKLVTAELKHMRDISDEKTEEKAKRENEIKELTSKIEEVIKYVKYTRSGFH